MRALRVGLVIEDNNDRFIRPVEVELHRHHQVDRFLPHFVRLPFIGKRVNDLLLLAQLARFQRRHDVVFFEWAGELAALASHQACDAYRIVRAHRFELFASLSDFRWESVDRLIFVSNAMRARFLAQFPSHTNRTAVIHNGVDLSRFAPQTREFTWSIGMLGNLIPRKRVYDVICALSELPDDAPWRLHVGGAPVPAYQDYWDALQGLVHRLGLSDRVDFDGQVFDPPAWFDSIDIFVSASYSEGQQVSLLEAMASGCYCLSHCWDGVQEILPSSNLFITDTELRARLVSYAGLPENEKQVARAYMRSLAEERFDERRMVREIVDLIERVAAGGAPRK
jgi:glycosyltransferase involved in cell wall biosynthesis